ncbi:MAG: ribosome-associated translation inhibitor RaiA [Chloroflexi bacterium]|nr:ribosome-associated translation inhibitor RaiA [Chloroflexota bacterium]
MQLSITGRNVEVTDYTREYVEKKMQRVERHLPGMTEARVELTSENTKGSDARNVAQITLRSGGKILRGEERGSDLFTAIDMAMEKVVRQVDRFKEKRHGRKRRSAGLRETVDAIESLPVALAEAASEPPPASPDDLEYEAYLPIVRTKRFQTSPMSAEEAIEQMELIGHSFFVFYNESDGGVNVLYRRNDGDYGLLIPELG